LAVYKAQQLWDGLAVLLGSSEKDYRFALVNAPENIVETEVEAPWVGEP